MMRSSVARGTLATVFVLAMLSTTPGSLAPRAASADGAIPADLLSFSHDIAILVRENRVGDLADLFAESQVTCPVDPVFPAEVCQDIPDGTVVRGYHVGRLQSQPGVVGRQTLEDLLAEFLGNLAPSESTVRTIARNASQDCESCAIVVIGESASAVPANVLLVGVRRGAEGYEAHRLVGGLTPDDSGAALLNGGAALGLHFVVPASEPYPPATGTGNIPHSRAADDSSHRLAMLVSTALATSAVLLSLSRGAGSFRRRRASGRT